MKRLEDQTLYEILDIAPEAARADIAKAYERAKAVYGPGSLATYTLMDPEEAALLARRIEEARSILLDPHARMSYDGRLKRAAAAPAPAQQAAPPPVIPPVIPPMRVAEAGLGPVAPEPQLIPLIPEAPEPALLLAAAAAAAGPPEPSPVAPAEPPRPAPSPSAPVAAAAVPVPFTVPEGTPWSGEVLRRVREGRGLTVRQIAERTRVTRHHIENIEAERFGLLPAPVYLRGIVMSMARELRLDGQKVARSYLDRAAAAAAAAGPPAAKGR